MSPVAASASIGVNAATLLLLRARPTRTLGAVRIVARATPSWRAQTRWNSSFGPRVGKAVEPAGGWDGKTDAEAKNGEEVVDKDAVKETKKETEQKTENKAAGQTEAKPTFKTPQTKSVVKLEENQDQPDKSQKHDLDPRAKTRSSSDGDTIPSAESESGSTTVKTEGTPPLDPESRQIKEEAKQSGPLEAVLHMETPQKVARSHPHMSPPPYVHHFDSYSLVKQLQDGGYSPDQAIEAMKGIRALLAQNLDVAQESLVSKSDVENETYLFRAACSELGQEIKNNRRLSDEQVRQQRTLLQHEVDILTQSLNQEVLSLNDNVRGMFNDRRMAVREEQKNADSAVQQINYKISTMLVSDSKSEIESVRWVLIRRSALGIFFMAMLTMATVRYATYVSKERQRQVAREKEEEERVRRDGGKRDNSSAADAAVILAAN